MSTKSCPASVSLDELTDYWLGDLPPEREAFIDEHILACDACCRSLETIIGLAGGVHALVREGGLRGILTSSSVDRLVAEGLRVREYRLAPGEQIPCTVTYEDDLLIGRLGFDPSGSKQVDVVICDAEGKEEERWPDIPLAPSTGEVIFVERMDTLRALPDTTMIVRLVSVDDRGERLLGEYTFNHTRSI